MPKPSTLAFVDLYDRYSAILYGIALQIGTTEKDVARILLTTFEKAQEQNIIDNNGHCIWATLIKLTTTTARQQMEGQFNEDCLPKLFPANQLMHKVLLEDKTIHQIRNEANLTTEELGKMIREELNIIRDAQNEKAARQLQQTAL